MNSISKVIQSLSNRLCIFWSVSFLPTLSGWAGPESKEGLIGQTSKPLAEHAALWLCLLLRPVVTQGWLQLFPIFPLYCFLT